MSSSINCHYCIYSLLTCFLPLSEEVVVDLARAEDELPDTVGVLRGGPVVGDEAVELAAGGQVVEGGLALRQAEERLWRHDDQRLAEGQRDLSPQDVEVGGRPRAIGHDHVGVRELLDGELVLQRREVLGVVGAQLQEPLRSRRGVLRPHPFHAMGQEHHEDHWVCSCGGSGGGSGLRYFTMGEGEA